MSKNLVIAFAAAASALYALAIRKEARDVQGAERRTQALLAVIPHIPGLAGAPGSLGNPSATFPQAQENNTNYSINQEKDGFEKNKFNKLIANFSESYSQSYNDVNSLIKRVRRG